MRANHPVPPPQAIFYFEVQVISSGREGYIGAAAQHGGVEKHSLHATCCRLPLGCCNP